ncbi:MAG: SUMF1/EgtB/PvdO family nonheme iron enzyme [Desulfobacterales bacterium]|nr:MAG: SUMF1/EgtB/PvdO family nonheme iron enzyme [Desulfobacterales bacterium]
MSGNVEELCLNDYSNPHQIDVTGKGRRCVRGGSWLNDQLYARCAYRFNFNPDLRLNLVGFRLCNASSIFSTTGR